MLHEQDGDGGNLLYKGCMYLSTVAKCKTMLHNIAIGRNHHLRHYDIDALRKTYAAIKAGLSCRVDQSDYDKLAVKLPFIEELARVENRSISLYDINQASFLLKVDRHLELLGYSKNDHPNDIDIERYHAMIHPDDLPFMYDSEIKMYRFLSEKQNRKKEYKLVYDYRVRSKGGSYIRFLHQMAIFECDRQGNSWIMLIVSDVLEQYPENESPRRFIIDTKDNRICLFNEESGIVDQLVTQREREILALVAQGLDSQSIAERLCISLHTVNNHRQNILRKTRSRHIAQAAFYLRCIGLL